MAAVPETIESIGVLAAFRHKAGINEQGLLMLRRHDLGDGALVERHPVKLGGISARKSPLVIKTIAAHIAKGGMSRKHEHEPQQMGDKFALRFLGWFETTQ